MSLFDELQSAFQEAQDILIESKGDKICTFTLGDSPVEYKGVITGLRETLNATQTNFTLSADNTIVATVPQFGDVIPFINMLITIGLNPTVKNGPTCRMRIKYATVTSMHYKIELTQFSVRG